MDPMAQRSLERDRRQLPIPDWLAGRLGIGRAVDPTPEDPADDRALIARALAFLFFAGATLSVIWLKLPHSPRASETGVTLMTVGAYSVGLVLIVGFDRLPMFALKAAITAATIVITGAVLATHENGSPYVAFYFWATVYAFSFFSLRQALGQTALMGVAFALRARGAARPLAGQNRSAKRRTPRRRGFPPFCDAPPASRPAQRGSRSVLPQPSETAGSEEGR